MSTLKSWIWSRRTAIALAGATAVGLYLRLWHIDSLFAIFHDYDPGAYALGARFMSEGLMPYRDFALVHPPLYNLVLAGVYKVFGYDYFYGAYFSVALSVTCIGLVYLIGRRLYSERVGIVAAALFAVEPLMVYLGRRSVQEMLGLTLILSAAVLAIKYLETRRRVSLFWSGVLLGLGMATKYVFGPVAVALVCAVWLVSAGPTVWQDVRRLGSLRFWAIYACTSAALYALLFVLKYVMLIPVALPLIEPVLFTAEDLSVVMLILVAPLLVAILLTDSSKGIGRWVLVLLRSGAHRGMWPAVAGGALGFLCVTGYYLATVPQEFLTQTLLLQQGHPGSEFPSLVALVRLAPLISGYFRMSCLSVIFVLPLLLILLNRRSFNSRDCFLVVVLAVTVLFSQGFYQLPRYYAAIYPFMLLAVASLTPAGRLAASDVLQKVGLLLVTVILLMGVSLSVVLLANYSGYDVFGPGIGSNEREVYDDTAGFLRSEGARKVFATNPIFPAMMPDLESSLGFDTFAVLWLEQKQPQEIVAGLRAEGVDHIVVDQWARFWGQPYKQAVDGLLSELRRAGSLVGLVHPDSDLLVEVYRLGPAPSTLVNGDFAYWADYEGMRIPLGWNPVLIGGEGDSADIHAADLTPGGGVRFIVYEDGLTEADATSTHAGLSRHMAFPRTEVRVDVMPGVNTESLGATPLGPAIHFLDGEGHSVILGFSDAIEEEQVAVCSECGHVAVMQPAPLYRWSEHSIDVGKYWLQAGWEIPEELTVLVVLSAHADYPGFYTFHVGSVTCDSPA